MKVRGRSRVLNDKHTELWNVPNLKCFDPIPRIPDLHVARRGTMRHARLLAPALALILLLVPQAAEAQRTARFHLRTAVGLGLPTGTFSEATPWQGGYAFPGVSYSVGAIYSFRPGVSLHGGLLLSQFPANGEALSVHTGQDVGDPVWAILGYTLSFRTDFAEPEYSRVFMEFGFGNYMGDLGVTEGPLGSDEAGRATFSLNAGMGVLIHFGRFAAELSSSVHLPTLHYDDINDRSAYWLSLNAGLLYGIF